MMPAEDFVPLAIAGLMEDNMRIRSNAIAVIRRKFGWPADGLDWQADDAEGMTRRVAASFLDRLGQGPRWAPYVPCS